MFDKLLQAWGIFACAVLAYIPSPTTQELEKVKPTTLVQRKFIAAAQTAARLEPLPTIAGYAGMTYYLSQYLAHNLTGAISFSVYVGVAGHTIDETILRKTVQSDVYRLLYNQTLQSNGFFDALAYIIHKKRNDTMNKSGHYAQKHMLISILLIPLIYLHIQQIIKHSQALKEKLNKRSQQDSGGKETTDVVV